MNQEVLVLFLAQPLIYYGYLCDATTHRQAEHSGSAKFAEPNVHYWEAIRSFTEFFWFSSKCLALEKQNPCISGGNILFSRLHIFPVFKMSGNSHLSPLRVCVLCPVLFSKEHLEKEVGWNYLPQIEGKKGSGVSCSENSFSET